MGLGPHLLRSPQRPSASSSATTRAGAANEVPLTELTLVLSQLPPPEVAQQSQNIMGQQCHPRGARLVGMGAASAQKLPFDDVAACLTELLKSPRFSSDTQRP